MSKNSGARGGSRVPVKTQINVYLPDEPVAQLRKNAENELRGLSATIQIALERYLADKSPETANALRAALEREGISTT